MPDELTRPPADLAGGAAPGYDALQSLASAELAATVYDPPSAWCEACDRAGYLFSVVVDDGSAQAGVCGHPDVVGVVVRGSSQASDWRDDLDVLPVRWAEVLPVGRVCRGFRRQALRLSFPVRRLVDLLDREWPGVPLVLAGHSMGGAVAPLLALELEAGGRAVRSVYAHEAPRFATRAAADWYDAQLGARTFRVVTVERGCRDAVTQAPPSRLGFAHVGIPEIIVDGVRYESEAAWDEVRRTRRPGWVGGWRVLGRSRAALDAHLSSSLLRTLRGVQAAG